MLTFVQNLYRLPGPLNILYTADTTFAILLAIILLPLASFFTLFRAQKLREQSGYIASGFLGLNLILSILLLIQIWNTYTHIYVFDWFNLGKSHFKISFLVDKLCTLMAVLVNLVSFLVHVYSIEYMETDKHKERYFGYLGLFTFSMLGIVTTDGLLIMFMFWELVGLSSYLLIGFWYQNKAAAKASMKAFILNRIGDLGFLIGLMSVWAHLGTFEFHELYAKVGDILGAPQGWGLTWETSWLWFMGLGLFCGCIGKSAQFPLQVWLPDAMQGPTPASALIHAATMVAAGVFLLARVFPLLIPEVLVIIAFIGAITAFLGAFTAISQFDIKKILAYSTISQLGYMVMAMGTANYDGAMFHLFTHASFKAVLFLAVGAVIHAVAHYVHEEKSVADPQDIRNLGGLKKTMPFTYYAFLFAVLAAAGIPLFSGFLSKDMILSGAWAWADVYAPTFSKAIYIVPLLGFITVFLTAYYMGRQLFGIFWGESRLPRSTKAVGHMHEAGPKMLFAMGILAIGSFFFVFSWNPLNAENSWLINNINMPVTEAPIAVLVLPLSQLELVMHHNHLITSIISVVLAFSGLGLAYARFAKNTAIAEFESTGYSSWWMKLSYKSFYLDSLYHKKILMDIIALARRMNAFETKVIDGCINFIGVFTVISAHVIHWIDSNLVDGFVHLQAFIARRIGSISRNSNTGQIQKYIAISTLSVIVAIVFILFN